MNSNRIYSLVIYLIWYQWDEALRETNSNRYFVFSFTQNTKLIQMPRFMRCWRVYAIYLVMFNVHKHLKHTKAIINATTPKPLVVLWTGLLVCFWIKKKNSSSFDYMHILFRLRFDSDKYKMLLVTRRCRAAILCNYLNAIIGSHSSVILWGQIFTQ